MKAKYIISVSIIVIGLLGLFMYSNSIKKEYSHTDGITTVLTLEDEIQKDTIWCGTFQLLWNDLKNDIAKQDIILEPQLQVVENLNKETFTMNDLSDAYYYKKIGIPSIALKKEIEKSIKDKFNETSTILDDFNWDNSSDKDYFLYVMLKKEFQFECAFEELEEANFGVYENIKYFGITKDSTEEIRNQVKVLYYNSPDDFAIQLKTKQEDEVILSKNPVGKTFNEIYDNVLHQSEKYSGSKELKEGEIVKIPEIRLQEKNEFVDIQNKSFLFSDGTEYEIEKAIQTIEFELNKNGGKVKSEAGMAVNYSSLILEEKREFLLDDSFVIFLIEEGKSKPYFAGKIDDITKFQ